jgi:hypothetical protein
MHGRLWPAHDAPEPWQGVVRQLYGHLSGRKLLWTPARGGSWLAPDQALLPDAACWETPPPPRQQLSDATQPAGGSDVQQPPAADGFGPLGHALLALGLPLAALPAGVLDMVVKYLVSG